MKRIRHLYVVTSSVYTRDGTTLNIKTYNKLYVFFLPLLRLDFYGRSKKNYVMEV